MRRTFSYPSPPGFGLVEVLIALVVLGGGMLALVRLQTDLFGASGLSKQRTEATALCQRKAEELRSFVSLERYDADLSALAGVKRSDPDVQGETAVFKIEYELTDIQTDPIKGRYVDVSVTCSWTDSQNKGHTVRLGSSISRAAPANVGYAAQKPSAADPARCVSGEVEWTKSGVSCSGSINTSGDVGTVVTVQATNNTGLNQYMCTASGTWSAVTSYSSTCTSRCPAQTVNWYGARGEACISGQPLPVTNSGSTALATDLQIATNQATFLCADGTWQLSASPASTCVVQCPATKLLWGNQALLTDENICAANFPQTASNAATTTLTRPALTVTNPPNEGTFQCSPLGSWQLVGMRCQTDSFSSCPSVAITWGAANRCSGVIPSTPAGSSSTVIDPTGNLTNNFVGRATFACPSTGVWPTPSITPAASPAATCADTCRITIGGTKVNKANAAISYKASYQPPADYFPNACSTGGGSAYSNCVLNVVAGQTYVVKSSRSTKTNTLTNVTCGAVYNNVNF